MKDEIKEILDKLKKLCYDDYCLEFSVDYIERKEEKLLLDHITNLQLELDYQRQAEIEYNEKHTKLMNKYKNLQNENERFAQENKNLSVVKKQAVEYIKFTSNLKYENEYVGLFIKDVCNNLLNILNSNTEEEKDKEIERLNNIINGEFATICKEQMINKLSATKKNVANISVDATSDLGNVDLENVNASNPMTVKIKPIGEDISYLYPSNTLYPSNDLYMKNRVLRFTNLTTNEIFDYELPEDLLWYDQDNYDELILSYGNGSDKTVYVNKKCKHTATSGVNELLSQEEIHEYAYPTYLNLSSGNYHVELLGYSSAYLYVQLMASNIYTSQYATDKLKELKGDKNE